MPTLLDFLVYSLDIFLLFIVVKQFRNNVEGKAIFATGVSIFFSLIFLSISHIGDESIGVNSWVFFIFLFSSFVVMVSPFVRWALRKVS